MCTNVRIKNGRDPLRNKYIHRFTGNVRHTMSLAIYKLSKIWLRQNAIVHKYEYTWQKYERYMFTHTIEKETEEHFDG